MNIYAGRLSYGVTVDDLQKAFTEFGEVVSVKVIKKATGLNKIPWLKVKDLKILFGFLVITNQNCTECLLSDNVK